MKKIAVKLFFMINGIIISLLLMLFLSNFFLLENYYLKYKKQQIIELAESISKDRNQDLERLGEKNNLRIEIFNRRRYNMSIMHMRRPPDFRGRRSMENEENEISFDNIGYEPQIKFMIQKNEKSPKFIMLTQKMSEDEVLVIHSPIFAINEAVKISTNFLFIIFIFGVVISVVMSILFSNKISSPIKKIEHKAEEISNLNFDSVLEIDREDELGKLAESINKLSANLKNAINNLQISNDRLKVEVQKEKEIDKFRREFIDSINHELKTPIAIIEGYAEGLLDNVNSEEDKEFYCNVIIDESKKMDELVKKILLLSRYDSYSHIINKTNFDISELLEKILKKYRLDIEKKNFVVSKQYKKEINAYGDYAEINTVMDNYINNAIGHAKDGDEIIIIVEEDNENTYFSISNSSEKIETEMLESLFEPFSKVDKSRNRRYGGTGLGLSIVKKIIKLHGGEYGALYRDGRINFFFSLKKPKIKG
jgi:signal transduction histidine kinase